MLRAVRGILFFFIIIAGMAKYPAAQEIVRLELDASNLNLPYYTIPAGDKGMIVFRGTEIKGRRIVAWELIHYDVSFSELHRTAFNTEKGEYFAGWKTIETHVTLLFFNDQPLTSGDVIVYDLQERKHLTKSFSLEGRSIGQPVFRLADSTFYLCGISRPKAGGIKRFFGAAEPGGKPPELVCVTGSLTGGEINVKSWKVGGIKEILYATPDSADKGLIMVYVVDEGRYMNKIRVVNIFGDAPDMVHKGVISSTPESCFSDVCVISTDTFPMALTGTYGSMERRYWNSEEPVLAKGFFFAPLDPLVETEVRFYPFSTFKNLTSANIRAEARNSQPAGRRGTKDLMAFRVLLHDKPYLQNGNLIIVGETYYPEYEYDNRMQSYYIPYSYYGYYPGFYDTGGRWVFKGFRYQHAVVAAFDQKGDIVWENSFETSNILDKQLITRLSLLPVAGEVVLVYAHEGKVWFRVIKANEVVVDKESFPVELPTPGERVREHISMNMAGWYDNYFLVWGRQTIRSNEGRSRTVYYCNKLAFE